MAASIDASPQNRLTVSDLPILPSQRTSVDNILHSFKKGGDFDNVRRAVFQSFNEPSDNSESKTALIDALSTLVGTELEKNPSLLGKDRRQAAPLIDGAAERTGAYRIAESHVDELIDYYLKSHEVSSKLHTIRHDAIGDEAYAEEQRKASLPDSFYEEQLAALRLQRREAREKEEKAARKAEFEALKKREEELLRLKKVAEEKALERQRLKEEAEQKKREWEAEMEERRERKEKQDRQWAREREEREAKEREQRIKDMEKDLESEALMRMLAEGRTPAKGAAPKKERKETQLEAIMRKEKSERESEKKSPYEDTSEEHGQDQFEKEHRKPRHELDERRHQQDYEADDYHRRKRSRHYDDSYEDSYRQRDERDQHGGRRRTEDERRPRERDDYKRHHDERRHDRYHEDRHHEERHRDDRHRDDRHHEDRHHDHRHHEDRHREHKRHHEDRHHEDRHQDSRHHEDRQRHTRDRSGSPRRASERQKREDRETPIKVDRYVPGNSSVRALDSMRTTFYDRAAEEERPRR